MIEKVTEPGAIELDRFAGSSTPAQVMWVEQEDDVAGRPRELEHAVALVRLLDDELQRPPDAGTSALLGAALEALLTLVRRWQVGSATGTPAAVTDPEPVPSAGRRPRGAFFHASRSVRHSGVPARLQRCGHATSHTFLRCRRPDDARIPCPGPHHRSAAP